MQTTVLLFIYNRLKHTLETVSAILSQRQYVKQIIIFCDKPKDDETQNIQNKIIAEITSLMHSVNYTNFKFCLQEQNLGIAKSITGETNKFAQENRHLKEPFVVIEDDCVPQEGFFKFFTQAFDKFKDVENVYTICGYQYIESPTERVKATLTRRFNPWGWGSWSHKWNFKFPIQEVRNRMLFHLLPESVSRFLVDERFVTGEIDIWSISVIYKQYTNNLLTIIPTRRLVRNIGFDGTGVHSTDTDVFSHYLQLPVTVNEDAFNNVEVNEETERLTESFLKEHLTHVMYKKNNQTLDSYD